MATLTAMPGRTAFVTGASRGIGRATALALAAASFDVAITARTLRPGEGRDESDKGEGRPIPGSLEETAAAIAGLEGARRVLPVVSDLLDHDSLDAGVEKVLAEWGHIDVLVNNAVESGPGSMVPFLDLSTSQLSSKLMANVVAQVVVTKALLPSMLERGEGTIVDVSSAVAVSDPPAPVGQGGWGFAYAASKAAFHRLAPSLAVELGDRGIRAYNVDPGFVDTERQVANAAALGLGRYRGAPPTVPAAVIAWLVTSPEAAAMNGQSIRAQKMALERGLHPDWRTGH